MSLLLETAMFEDGWLPSSDQEGPFTTSGPLACARATSGLPPGRPGRGFDAEGAAQRIPPPLVETERRNGLHEQRTTPMLCGNIPGSNVKDAPQRTAGDRYTTDAYRRAITRACDQALQPPPPLARRDDETEAKWQKRLTEAQRADLDAWRKAHRWHPHQLRHDAATELRKEFGIEAARIILGHRSATITEVYAEKDEQQAVAAMVKIGWAGLLALSPSPTNPSLARRSRLSGQPSARPRHAPGRCGVVLRLTPRRACPVAHCGNRIVRLPLLTGRVAHPDRLIPLASVLALCQRPAVGPLGSGPDRRSRSPEWQLGGRRTPSSPGTAPSNALSALAPFPPLQ